MKTKTLTAAVLILASVPAFVSAQDTMPMRPQPPQVDFAAADADSSGGISVEEWTAHVTELMAERRTEMMGTRADALIAAGDANADSQLNRDELISGFGIIGERRREMRENRRENRRGEGRGWLRGGRHGHGEMRGHGDYDDGHHGMRGEGRRGGHGGMEPGQRVINAFERIDLNGDGQIDAEELELMQEMMQRRMERRNN